MGLITGFENKVAGHSVEDDLGLRGVGDGSCGTRQSSDPGAVTSGVECSTAPSEEECCMTAMHPMAARTPTTAVLSEGMLQATVCDGVTQARSPCSVSRCTGATSPGGAAASSITAELLQQAVLASSAREERSVRDACSSQGYPRRAEPAPPTAARSFTAGMLQEKALHGGGPPDDRGSRDPANDGGQPAHKVDPDAGFPPILPRTAVMIFSAVMLEAVREGGSHDGRPSWGTISNEEERLCASPREEEKQYLCAAPLEDSNSTVFGQADVSGLRPFFPSAFFHGCMRGGSCGEGAALRVAVRDQLAGPDRPEAQEEEVGVAPACVRPGSPLAAPCSAAVSFNVGIPPEAVCDGRSLDDLKSPVSSGDDLSDFGTISVDSRLERSLDDLKSPVSSDDDLNAGGTSVAPPRTAVMSFTSEMLDALRGRQSHDTRDSWTVSDSTNTFSHRHGAAL